MGKECHSNPNSVSSRVRSTFLCLFRNVEENYVGYNIIGSSYVLTKIRKDNNDFTIFCLV